MNRTRKRGKIEGARREKRQREEEKGKRKREERKGKEQGQSETSIEGDRTTSGRRLLAPGDADLEDDPASTSKERQSVRAAARRGRHPWPMRCSAHGIRINLHRATDGR